MMKIDALTAVQSKQVEGARNITRITEHNFTDRRKLGNPMTEAPGPAAM